MIIPAIGGYELELMPNFCSFFKSGSYKFSSVISRTRMSYFENYLVHSIKLFNNNAIISEKIRFRNGKTLV